MNDIDTVGGSIGWAWIGTSTLGSQKVSATVPLGRPAMATMSPASANSTGCALEAAEGEDLGDAAGFDHLAVARQHLHRLVRLDRTGSDAAGDDAAEIGIGLENGAEQAERAFLDHGRRDMA